MTVARDATVLSCASLAERDNLHALLDRCDISTICLEENDWAGICIISDVDFAMRLVAQTGTRSLSFGSKTVVTELDSSELRVHLDGDYERAISLARQIHERMYPGTAKPFVSRTIKQRSAYSSLLIRGNNARGNPE